MTHVQWTVGVCRCVFHYRLSGHRPIPRLFALSFEEDRIQKSTVGVEVEVGAAHFDPLDGGVFFRDESIAQLLSDRYGAAPEDGREPERYGRG